MPRLTPAPQIRRVSRQQYCALYKFIYLLTYLLKQKLKIIIMIIEAVIGDRLSNGMSCMACVVRHQRTSVRGSVSMVNVSSLSGVQSARLSWSRSPFHARTNSFTTHRRYAAALHRRNVTLNSGGDQWLRQDLVSGGHDDRGAEGASASMRQRHGVGSDMRRGVPSPAD